MSPAKHSSTKGSLCPASVCPRPIIHDLAPFLLGRTNNPTEKVRGHVL